MPHEFSDMEAFGKQWREETTLEWSVDIGHIEVFLNLDFEGEQRDRVLDELEGKWQAKRGFYLFFMWEILDHV